MITEINIHKYPHGDFYSKSITIDNVRLQLTDQTAKAIIKLLEETSITAIHRDIAERYENNSKTNLHIL